MYNLQSYCVARNEIIVVYHIHMYFYSINRIFTVIIFHIISFLCPAVSVSNVLCTVLYSD